MTGVSAGKTILNISELANGFNLDRATVRKRIQLAGIAPVEQKAKETRYRLDKQLQEILLASDTDLDAEKLRKTRIEADLKDLELKRLKGELASVREFQEIVQALFGGLYKEIAVRLPKRIGGRVSRAKTAAEASAVLQKELNSIFVSVRNDFQKFLDKEKKAAPAKPAPKAARSGNGKK